MKVQCNFCGKEIQLKEGDVVFGGNWYHKNCAKKTLEPSTNNT